MLTSTVAQSSVLVQFSYPVPLSSTSIMIHLPSIRREACLSFIANDTPRNISMIGKGLIYTVPRAFKHCFLLRESAMKDQYLA